MMELILNPVAGSGRAKRALRLVERELDARGIAYHISETACPDHATQLTREAIARGCDAVVVLGGDGLQSEVCAALIGTDVTLYFVPCGTGNDFIKALRLPRNPLRALRLQLDSPTRLIDCGTANEHTFLNIGGLGFDIEVLAQTELFKRNMNGIWPYLYGLLKGLALYKPTECSISIDGIDHSRSYTVVSMANGRYFGGGMKAAPLADVADGLFDVMMVDALPKWKLYACVPLFIPGWHAKLSFVHRIQAREVVIRCAEPFSIQLDGELKNVTEATFTCRPASIRIACPAVQARMHNPQSTAQN